VRVHPASFQSHIGGWHGVVNLTAAG
jgi:hypothetical protein